jgi:hypothetical protein
LARVRELIRTTGLSNRAIARAVGCGRGVVAEVRNGKRRRRYRSMDDRRSKQRAAEHAKLRSVPAPDQSTEVDVTLGRCRACGHLVKLPCAACLQLALVNLNGEPVP